MNTYYLRCRQSRRPTLVSRGIRMGVITMDGDSIVPVGQGCWDEIGTKVEVDEAGNPVGGLAGGDADPWWHINFRTEHDLRERALAAAQAGDADIAAGLAEIAAYFITDADGNVAAPAVPMRVFL